jgi:hypothetical protein
LKDLRKTIKTSVRIADVPTGIQTEDHPNKGNSLGEILLMTNNIMCIRVNSANNRCVE